MGERFHRLPQGTTGTVAQTRQPRSSRPRSLVLRWRSAAHHGSRELLPTNTRGNQARAKVLVCRLACLLEWNNSACCDLDLFRWWVPNRGRSSLAPWGNRGRSPLTSGCASRCSLATPSRGDALGCRTPWSGTRSHGRSTPHPSHVHCRRPPPSRRTWSRCRWSRTPE